MFRNEREFSQRLCAALKKRKMHPVQIETGLTQQGVPDLFIMTHGDDVWVELKNVYGGVPATVDWRPGQIAWHSLYYKHHHQKKCVYTVVALSKGFIIIPMTKMFKDNIICKDDYMYKETIGDVIDVICM